jgi:hypothetical protein
MRRNLFHFALLPLILGAGQAWADAPAPGALPQAATPQAVSPMAMTPPVVTPMTANAAPSYASFTPDQADYVKRVVMIPMRDGVKLYTVIVFKKGVSGAQLRVVHAGPGGLRQAGRHDPDAGRREALHRHRVQEGRERRPDPAVAHAL